MTWKTKLMTFKKFKMPIPLLVSNKNTTSTPLPQAVSVEEMLVEYQLKNRLQFGKSLVVVKTHCLPMPKIINKNNVVANKSPLEIASSSNDRQTLTEGAVGSSVSRSALANHLVADVEAAGSVGTRTCDAVDVVCSGIELFSCHGMV